MARQVVGPQNHPHGGHRARLRKRQLAEGLSAFEPHEVLELLLYAVIPQRDVNPLAHALIDRFGSVAGVLAASPAALVAVPGMGRQSAEWFAFLNETTARYARLRLSDRPRITNVRQMSLHCARLFEPPAGDQIWLMCMNMAGHLLGSSQLCAGRWQGRLTLRQAVEPALRYHAQTALLLIKRAGGQAAAEDEVAFVRALATQFARVRIRLLDGVVIVGHSVLSMRNLGLYRLEGELAESELARLCEHWLDEV